MNRAQEIKELASELSTMDYRDNFTYIEDRAEYLIDEGWRQQDIVRKEVATEILSRLLKWKSAVIFDVDTLDMAERKFEEYIKALATEEYDVNLEETN